MRHPLESKFVHEGRQPRLSFQMARTLLALGAAKGLPSVITMRTAAGICRVTSRAMMPPRLQPTRLTFKPESSRSFLTCAATAETSASGARTLRPRPQPVDLIAEAFEKTTDSDSGPIVRSQPRQDHHRVRLSSRRGSQEGRRSEQRRNIQQPPPLGGEQSEWRWFDCLIVMTHF
jgi:hypothetical protein